MTKVLSNFSGQTVFVGMDIHKASWNLGTLLHCMAHARRMFHDAMDNDAVRAGYAMEEIQKLYAIERICKDENLNHDQVTQVRQEMAVSVLESLREWMKEQYMQTTPKSAIRKALAYSIERWKRLSIYAGNGMLVA